SRQVNLYICLSITFAAATLVLVLRLIERRITKLHIWYDDWLAIFAFKFAIPWCALVLWWVQISLGLHHADNPLPQAWVLEQSRLILWLVELIYSFSLPCAKLSILALYWRMFSRSTIRVPIQIVGVCVMIWLTTILTILHCIPVQKFWQPSIPGHCAIADSAWFFGTVLTHPILDILVLSLPIIEIWRLQLPFAQKVAVTWMFMFGIFVCMSSVVVLYYSIRYDQHSIEMPWNISPNILWSTAEVNLAVVTACLPMLRPIYLLVARCLH
ncbi:hypothetical protein BCR34DRAFT_439635, partial [Clohesyomyces aquaticus]